MGFENPNRKSGWHFLTVLVIVMTCGFFVGVFLGWLFF